MRITQRKGDIAVTQAIALFTSMGYDVSVPITESAAYDLVVDANNLLHRVQVKYSCSKLVDLRRIHSNASGYVVKKTEINAYDWLYIYRADLNQHYIVKKCLHNRSAVTANERYLVIPPTLESLGIGVPARLESGV